MPVAKGEPIDLDRTRGKVMRAAAELFYAQTTTVGVNDVAKRAGVSKLTLYRHFGSKDGLLEAVLRERCDRLTTWLREASSAPEDPVERVLAVFDTVRGWYAERGYRGCGVVNAATESPEGPAPQLARELLDRYRELFTALARDAGASDPERAGRQLLILIEGATVVAALTGEPGAADDARALARATLA